MQTQLQLFKIGSEVLYSDIY